MIELPERARALVDASRRAVLTSVDERGRPHAVPICWAELRGGIATAIDRKPKAPGKLQRVRNLERNPHATVLFDRYGEDWTDLGWVMVRGEATILPPGSATAELVARYQQYAHEPPEGEVIHVSPAAIVWWLWR